MIVLSPIAASCAAAAPKIAFCFYSLRATASNRFDIRISEETVVDILSCGNKELGSLAREIVNNGNADLAGKYVELAGKLLGKQETADASKRYAVLSFTNPEYAAVMQVINDDDNSIFDWDSGTEAEDSLLDSLRNEVWGNNIDEAPMDYIESVYRKLHSRLYDSVYAGMWDKFGEDVCEENEGVLSSIVEDECSADNWFWDPYNECADDYQRLLWTCKHITVNNDKGYCTVDEYAVENDAEKSVEHLADYFEEYLTDNGLIA